MRPSVEIPNYQYVEFGFVVFGEIWYEEVGIGIGGIHGGTASSDCIGQ